MRCVHLAWADIEVDAAEDLVVADAGVEVGDVQHHPMLPSRLTFRRRVASTANSIGQTRKVSGSATISYGGVIYSVPHTLAEQTVGARVDGEELILTQVSGRGAAEVARHRLSTPGHLRIDDAHPPRPPGALGR
jgi:hypothetical protein